MGGDLGRRRDGLGTEHLGEMPVHLAGLARNKPSPRGLGEKRVLQLRRTLTGRTHEAAALQLVQTP